MRPIRTTVIAVAALLAASVTATAAGPPSPPTVPGWPKRLPAGTVLQGPGSGPVLVWEDGSGYFFGRAFLRDGRRLWTWRHDIGCGNCDEGLQPLLHQPDGSYGPVGYSGDTTWAFDARGRTVETCSGALFPDGTCISGINGPAVAERAPGARAWTWQLPVPGAAAWASIYPPMTVRDRRGLVYTSFLFNAGNTSERPRPGDTGLLTAIDPGTRQILWTKQGPGAVLTGLATGVLVGETDWSDTYARPGVVAYRRDGSLLWRRDLPQGEMVSPATVAYDARRGRVYLGRVGYGPGARPGVGVGVTALDVHTGAEVWSTTLADEARLLSIGPGGRVYVSVGTGSMTLRALRLRDGSTAWERRGRQYVSSAVELRNGTVAVSLGGPIGSPALHRLTLLRPR